MVNYSCVGVFSDKACLEWRWPEESMINPSILDWGVARCLHQHFLRIRLYRRLPWSPTSWCDYSLQGCMQLRFRPLNDLSLSGLDWKPNYWMITDHDRIISELLKRHLKPRAPVYSRALCSGGAEGATAPGIQGGIQRRSLKEKSLGKCKWSIRGTISRD